MSDLILDAREWVTQLTKAFGMNPGDPNFYDTPRRVAESFTELLRGHSVGAQEEAADWFITKTFPTSHSELVVVSDINAAGVCPHHFLPVLYSIDFGYIPEGQALGLSKIPRIIQMIAARAVLQEDLTSDIAHTFERELKPRGLGVIVRGLHTCMAIRGVQARQAITTSSAMRGEFLENAQGVKDEFLALVHANPKSIWR